MFWLTNIFGPGPAVQAAPGFGLWKWSPGCGDAIKKLGASADVKDTGAGGENGLEVVDAAQA